MKPSLITITDIVIQKLNGEIKHWGAQASLASNNDDKEVCHKALKAQGEAIDTLIKIVKTYQKNLNS